jgi:hypothetical protein
MGAFRKWLIPLPMYRATMRYRKRLFIDLEDNINKSSLQMIFFYLALTSFYVRCNLHDLSTIEYPDIGQIGNGGLDCKEFVFFLDKIS